METIVQQAEIETLDKTTHRPGYLSAAYPRTLDALGRPFYLEQADAWLLERIIPGSGQKDLCGSYPLFCCGNWRGLKKAMDGLKERYITIALVTDPLGAYGVVALKEIFSDVCYPYKTHYIVDFLKENTVETNHARNIRKANKTITVLRESKPTACLDEWNRLYGLLILRHGIDGAARFSAHSFAGQFDVPGLRVYSARIQGRVVGMVLFYRMGDVVYYHLGAYDNDGYRSRASFAVFDRALRDFRAEGLRYLDLGSGAGLNDDPADGLARFKKGWANTTRIAWFCGKILNPPAYRELTTDIAAGFFPAYRKKL